MNSLLVKPIHMRRSAACHSITFLRDSLALSYLPNLDLHVVFYIYEPGAVRLKRTSIVENKIEFADNLRQDL